MSMLVTDCLEFISYIIPISCSFLSKDRSRFLFRRELTTLKHWCGMADSSLLDSNIKDIIFSNLGCLTARGSLKLNYISKNIQFLSFTNNPPTSYMPNDLVTLTFCNLIDFAIFWVTGNMSVYNYVNYPRQKFVPKILYYLTSSWHVRFPWPDLGKVLQKLTH